MNRALALIASFGVAFSANSAEAATSFRGTYLCSLDSSNTISDAAGNSVKISDFLLKVDRSGRIEIETKMTFRISGKSQTLTVEGKGAIRETFPNSEATFSFSLKPSRSLSYKGRAVSLKSKAISLYKSYGSAFGGGYLATPFGQASVTCGTP